MITRITFVVVTSMVLLGVKSTVPREIAALVGDRKILVAEVACDPGVAKDFCEAQMQMKLDARITDELLRKATARAGVQITRDEFDKFSQQSQPSDTDLATLEAGWLAVIDGAQRVLGGEDRTKVYEETVKPKGFQEAVFLDFLDKVRTQAAIDTFKVSVSATAIRTQMRRDAANGLRLMRIEEAIQKTCGQAPDACEDARRRFWREFLATCPVKAVDPRFRADLPNFIPGDSNEN